MEKGIAQEKCKNIRERKEEKETIERKRKKAIQSQTNP